MSKIKLALLAAALALPAGGAFANGCNGVVNQLVWGCAAWDNNNGPQFPNWHGAKAAPAPAAAPRAYTPPPSNIISTNGGGIVASGAGNIVASGAGNIVASGAGNMQHH